MAFIDYNKVTQHAEQEIVRLVNNGEPGGVVQADAILFFWNLITAGRQFPGDFQRLYALLVKK